MDILLRWFSNEVPQSGVRCLDRRQDIDGLQEDCA